ncbi:MAG: 5-3 exonuclease, C-terminal fold family protein [Nevskia sp.]|nr:5-3 exonuclease, C-terminal fold family protein [Nevskia sp.]
MPHGTPLTTDMTGTANDSTPAALPRLLLIDGLNVVRRIYEANPEPESPDKLNTAMRNSLASFRRALDEHRPSHALAVFDFGGPTWRHALYPRYREKRLPMPQMLRDALPAFYVQLASLLNLKSVALPQVEADDVIASVAQRWQARGLGPAIIISTDKDLCQLLEYGCLVRDHFKPEWRDAAWVQQKFGVPVAALGDWLALAGDDSDDIPGVRGIGPKGATKLIKAYQTLERVLREAAPLQGAVARNLREHAELARLSRQLVSFKTDVAIGLTWNALRVGA